MLCLFANLLVLLLGASSVDGRACHCDAARRCSCQNEWQRCPRAANAPTSHDHCAWFELPTHPLPL